MIAGIDTMMPAAVVNNASEMPRDSRAGSVIAPRSPSTPNARMLPVTVPSNPSKGAMWAMVPRAETNRSSFGISRLAVSSRNSRNSCADTLRSRMCVMPIEISAASGAWDCSQTPFA